MEKVNNETIDLDNISLENNKNVLVIIRYTTYGCDEGIYVLSKSKEHGKYIIAESYHCSCYGYDDTIYDGIAYTKKEIIKLCIASLNGQLDDTDEKQKFYKYVAFYFLNKKRVEEVLY